MSQIVRPIRTTIILLWFATYPVWKYTVLFPGLRGSLEWICDSWRHTIILNWGRLSPCLSRNRSMLWIHPRASNGTYQLPFLWMTHRNIVCPWFHWSRTTHWFPYLLVPGITCPLTPLSQPSFPFLEKTLSEFPQLLCQFQVHPAPYLRVQIRVFPYPWSPRLPTIHSIIMLIWLIFHLVPLLMEIFNQPYHGRHPPQEPPNQLTHNTPNLSQHFY